MDQENIEKLAKLFLEIHKKVLDSGKELERLMSSEEDDEMAMNESSQAVLRIKELWSEIEKLSRDDKANFYARVRTLGGDFAGPAIRYANEVLENRRIESSQVSAVRPKPRESSIFRFFRKRLF